ncbi:hypothetical protein MFLAVUS_006452 [Mucor flavus]|uniref:Uncharacterized protein n=1 Tax=Mucor flavus TaxID=439312 RepID=A0ABP9Z1K3_9FUNG
MMRALSGMRYTARYSVARCFFRENYITLEQLQSILKGNTSNNNNINSSGFIVTPPTTENNNNNNTQEDVNMDGSQLPSTLDTSTPPIINQLNDPIQENVFTVSLPETEEFSVESAPVESAPVVRLVRRKANN